MKEGNLVVFKGTADGIVVFLDELARFEEIIECFKQKLNASKTFFKDSKVGIRFKGRLLSIEEQEVLIRLLKKQNIIDVSFIHPFENEKSKENTITAIDQKMLWVKNELDTMNASLTHFHYGIVRSGMEITYPGNIVIFGDINPGGIIKAGGNVIVFGTIKGKIHAGLDKTFKQPFIMGKGMVPIQIGLKNVVAPCPREEEKVSEDLQIAYLVNEQIYVDILDSKSINHMRSSNE